MKLVKNKARKAYYAGGLRVMKAGVPVRVAPWYAELSREAQAMIGQVRIGKPYPEGMPFKQEPMFPEMAVAA